MVTGADKKEVTAVEMPLEFRSDVLFVEGSFGGEEEMISLATKLMPSSWMSLP